MQGRADCTRGGEPAGIQPVVPGYALQREIGRGGMGVVYDAVDLKHQGRVAIKHLLRVDPVKIARFKREFRAVADLQHPNLAGCHELIQRDGNWFLVMERVEGVPFVDCFLSVSNLGERTQRLRLALVQLVDGVRYLHHAGLIHCDIKPSNVLVTADGRVVLLDFGLLADWTSSGASDANVELVGSLGYLAPERYAGQAPSAASDWYAIGVMLFEALVGKRPFHGPRTSLIWQQRYMDPPAPAEIDPTLPLEWNELCVALLQRNPAQRLHGPGMLRWLRDGFVESACGPDVPASAREVPLVGRDRHLAALKEAFARVAEGKTVVVQVRGRTGMGKSTLVERYLERLAVGEAPTILRGRCFQQESVPYKGVDGLMDALGRHLATLSQTQLSAVLPAELDSLCRVFSVLRRIRATSAWGPPGHADPVEIRRHAVAALRKILNRLAVQRPLVLALDDLQWGDEDSAQLLSDLLAPPNPPPLLLLASYRIEEEDTSVCLRRWREALHLSDTVFTVVNVNVDALTALEASSLASTLLADSAAAGEDVADAIARESGGWPIYVHELAACFRCLPPDDVTAWKPGELVLDRVVGERLGRLPDRARRVLEVVAVAGQALRVVDAFRAAEIDGTARSALAALRAGQFIRCHGDDSEQCIECYHDCVREAVLNRLTPEERARTHDALARAYYAAHVRDRVLLAVHTLGAGRTEEAADHYAHAAIEAEEALAFSRAVELYRLSLELATPPADGASLLWRRLSGCLAKAGRVDEAAEAHRTAERHAKFPAIDDHEHVD